MIKKLTGFSVSEIQEGVLLSYSYSTIDASGVIVKRNETESRIIVNKDILNNVTSIQTYIVDNFIIL